MKIRRRSELNVSCSTCPVAKLCLPKHLQQTDIQHLDQLISHIQLVNPGEHIYYTNDEMKYLFAVRSGAFKDYKVNLMDGNERINNFYFAGDVLGLESLATKKYYFSAQALTLSQLCLIPIIKIEQSIATNYLIHSLVKTCSQALYNDKSFAQITNAKQRIANFLLNLHQRLHERNLPCEPMQMPMTQLDIANKLGLALETVNRVLHNLAKEKVVALHNAHALQILNFSTLESLGVNETQLEREL